MYTQEDRTTIRQRIIKYSVITGVLCALLIAAFVVFLVKRNQPLAMVSSCAMFAVFCFMWCMFLYPCIHYRTFLVDMASGLTREMQGTIVEISNNEDLQDGVRVLPVRILLDAEQDERIVYLNVSKQDLFPGEGTRVNLSCYGRHIKEAATIE